MAGEVETDLVMQSHINLDKLRGFVRMYIDKHQYKSALFWADKVVTLSNGETPDVYWLSQCLYLTGQYHRATHCIETRKLHQTNAACRFLAAKCHYEAKEYHEAIEILYWPENNSTKTPEKGLDASVTTANASTDVLLTNVESNVSLLKGKIYEAMDNRALAVECFTAALKQDVYCYEAFELLVQHHMMSAEEERKLLESLPFSSQCPEEEMELLRFMYEVKLKKYDKPLSLVVPATLGALGDNVDVVVNLAERHYYNCEFKDCFNITSAVLNKDPFHSDCLPVHIACLVELKKPNDLFYLAHKLVDLYPDKPVAWFAVGCYYLLVKKNDAARRYLSKATTLDRVYGPAWLAYGHSFAVENEHDQAMAAYFKASQLMKGCHLPLLYIGLEYGLTNNAKLADRFFSQALAIAPSDPFVLHEMGVIAFQNHYWETAEKYFSEALSSIEAGQQCVSVEKWEPLLNNLGHVCRKLKKYEEALDHHRRALILSPQNPSTYSAMGYVHSLLGNAAMAVYYFHKALGLRRDDTFSTNMLEKCMQQLLNELNPCEDVPDDLPIPINRSGVEEIITETVDDSELAGSHEQQPNLSSFLANTSDSVLVEEVSMDLEGSS
ncbi:PREDICTED: cell division cycle protein 16 homolog [Priapulus caudatus]|uniref:Cell division cycle protein 16 homolog n=1 Tax=Priapulus caudatus TaxID=37621 RepID=A0ABM1FAD5_PRICU|nr:PREDICTED: cell division cycle protein 16 homolog [Priapulus caudatus]